MRLTSTHHPRHFTSPRAPSGACGVRPHSQCCRRKSNLRARLPTRRVLPSVHSLNNDVLIGKSVIHGVWKSEQNRPPSFLVRSLIRQRIVDNTADDLLDGLSEFLAEPRTPCLVPFSRFKHFVFGLRPEDHLPRHAQPSSLRRTSDQGMAEPGFSMCSAQRRSSSARCASVNRTRLHAPNPRGFPKGRWRVPRDPQAGA